MTVRYFQPRLGAFHQLTFWSNIVNADYSNHPSIVFSRVRTQAVPTPRTDTLTFLWNPSQSFFSEHFSTKTPRLAFKLLLTFHGSESRRQEKLLKYLSHCHFSSEARTTDTFLLKCQVGCHQYFSNQRLRKWSPSLHIIIAPKKVLFTEIFFSIFHADIFHFNFSINLA